MTTSTQDALAASAAKAPFARIACGIDGSPSALEAAHQAAALAGPDTTIELIAVTDESTTDEEPVTGPMSGALLSARHAEEAVERARKTLVDCPARVIARTVHGYPAAAQLLEASADADLLVVGRHSISRLEGIMIGRTGSTLLHRAQVPLLLAVHPPEGLAFPGRILVAADGPDKPENAVRTATAIALATGAEVFLLRADWSHRTTRPELARAIADLQLLTGRAPVEIRVKEAPRHAIVRYAESERASLVILGSRGLQGVHALGSVSERVAHHSPCSVMVIRGHAGA